MISYPYTITNKQGQQVKLNDFVTDPNNFIALQDYPENDVDIKNAETEKEGQHGVWDFYSFYGKRVMSFSGVIVGQTEGDIEDLKRQLNAVFALPSSPSAINDGYVTIAWTDANGDDWQVSAKLARAIRFSRSMKRSLMLSFQFSVKCSYPFVVGSSSNTVSGTRGYQAVTWTLPTLLPMTFGINYYNKMSITSVGSVEADTVIRLYGEAGGITNPKITNITTGDFMQVNTTIADGDYIEINSETGEVYDNNGTDLSAYVTGDSTFVKVISGVNELLYESDENPYATLVLPTASFEVTYRDTTL